MAFGQHAVDCEEGNRHQDTCMSILIPEVIREKKTFIQTQQITENILSLDIKRL